MSFWMRAASSWNWSVPAPASLPPILKRHLDLTSGRERGRIYRVVPIDFERRPTPNLSDHPTTELVALLKKSRKERVKNAAAFARDRLQSRSITGVKNPEGPADPIIVHPDVRRMLLTQRVIAEGGRAMMGYASKYADIYRSGKTVEERAQAEDYLGFCTPILKAFLTEQGFHATSLGMQVFGGHGYIKEWGMEQILRDSRIAMLYEGTTGIQSLDLVGRKLLMDKFKLLNKFTGEMLEFSQQFLPWKKHPQFKQMWKRAGTIAYIAMQWRYLALRLGQRAKKDREAVGAGALDFLMFSGYAYMAFMWAKMEAQAYKMLAHEDGDEDFLQTKINSAEFFFERILPSAKTHASNVTASVESLMIIPKEQFSRT